MIDLREISKSGELKSFLTDLKAFFPDTYEDLKDAINRIENTKKVAALFQDVTSM